MSIMNNGRARGRLTRRVALSLTTILATGFATPAMAQEAPLHRNYDGNGVDQVSGTFRFPITEGEIGSGTGKLSMVRYRFSGGTRDNWSGELRKTVSGGTTTVTLNFGDISEKFTLTSGTYVSVKGNGSTLVENTTNMQFTYTASNGTRIVYESPLQLATLPGGANATIDMPSGYCNSSNATACGVPTSVKRPDQLEATLTWSVPARCTAEVTGQFPESGIEDCSVYYRLQDIRNNAGYGIKIKWKSNSFSGYSPVANWFNRDTLRFMDLGKVYCDPSATNCDSVAGISVSYATPSGGVEDFTDWQGGTWRFTAGSTYGIRRPGSGSDDITVSFSSGKVSSVAADGLTTSYSWSSGSGTATVVATDPSSNTTTTVSDTTKGQPTSVTNGTSNTVSFTYDSSGRVTRKTMPEGNYVNYAYDSRGNVTEVRYVAHAISGVTTPSDIVSTASFSPTCSNTLTCNQPDYTVDARGNRTDFTYDATHGGVTRIQFPAPTGSTRPEINFTYSAISAKVKDSGGSLVDAATPTYVLTQSTMCATAATCSGNANERVTSYTYGSGTSIDNLQPLTMTVAAGDGSITSTTTYTYDDAGNVLTEDGPLSTSVDTTRYRYDSNNRLIGVVSPDPDGGGSLKHRAVRYTYSSTGLVTTTEVGTVNSQSDSDWAGMTVLQTLTTTYDADDRKTKQVLSASGTTYAVTQYSYDSNGRLECTAVRMNPAEFASLPSSACTLDTAGSYGQDRIIKYGYDADGRVTQVQTGYGVSGVQANEVTTTYSANGQVATVTDAEGNKTSYSYDGFDRLWKTFYPSTTKGAGTSNSSDYAALTYDAGSNVTSRRLRDGNSIGYTYDNWGQVTAKDLPSTEPDVTYSYDFFGQPTGAVNSNATLTFAFDAFGRNTSQGGPLGAVSYTYDVAGRRTRMTWPDSFYIDYDYLVTSEVSAIRENGATSGVGVLATYGYDDLGRRTSLTYGNGTSTSYAYDNVSRLTSLGLNLDGGTTTNDTTTTFSYSPAGSIASQTRTNDLYAWGGHFNVNRSYTSNGLNQLTASGGTSLGYDSRGNLTSSGSDSFGYSSENLLTSATVASVSTTNDYDPLLRLFKLTSSSVGNRFQYDGTEVATIYDDSGAVLQRLVRGPGADEVMVEYNSAGTRSFQHADERGSIVARSDSSGAKTALNSYDEYGIPASGNAGRFQYTGQMLMPTLGLYYYKARFYSPTLGRFVQSDPIGYGDGMNFYAYTRNDPINFRDPSGLDVICDDPNHTRIPAYGPVIDGDPCENLGGIYEIVNGPARPGGGYGRNGDFDILLANSTATLPFGGPDGWGGLPPVSEEVCKKFKFVGDLFLDAGQQSASLGTDVAVGGVVLAPFTEGVSLPVMEPLAGGLFQVSGTLTFFGDVINSAATGNLYPIAWNEVSNTLKGVSRSNSAHIAAEVLGARIDDNILKSVPYRCK